MKKITLSIFITFVLSTCFFSINVFAFPNSVEQTPEILEKDMVWQASVTNGKLPEKMDSLMTRNRTTVHHFTFADGAITGYSGPGGDLIIPKTIDGASITSIGDWAFSDSANLTSVSIPDSVTSIGFYAFSGCTALTNISIPNSVTTICGAAFINCTGLTGIIIPDSVTSIGYSGFEGCTRITHISIPDSIHSIDFSLFYGCTNLESIMIPDSVTSIDSYAFNDCNSLTSIRFYGNAPSLGRYYPFPTSDFTVYFLSDSIGFDKKPWMNYQNETF